MNNGAESSSTSDGGNLKEGVLNGGTGEGGAN
jgi:hypothetical protein